MAVAGLSGHTSDAIRASVLEAALELGVENPSFTAWLGDSASGAVHPGKSSSSFPLNPSTGDSRLPYPYLPTMVGPFQRSPLLLLIF
jgi:hypothetical protein